jgi:hypothetical protein
MIFQHTWDKVMSGVKTQTRRLAKPGDRLRTVENPFGGYIVQAVLSASGKPRYQVGQTYAVQPGRGQKGLARIRITNIRREDVRQISAQDAKAEGFESPLDFLRLWVNLHDPSITLSFQARAKDAKHSGNAQAVIDLLASRSAVDYDAWALTFQLTDNYLTTKD